MSCSYREFPEKQQSPVIKFIAAPPNGRKSPSLSDDCLLGDQPQGISFIDMRVENPLCLKQSE